VVLASGAWSRELAEKLDINIPLVGGRGYSITFRRYTIYDQSSFGIGGR